MKRVFFTLMGAVLCSAAAAAGASDDAAMDRFIDKLMSFEDYINDESINAQRAKAYKNTKQVVLI